MTTLLTLALPAMNTSRSSSKRKPADVPDNPLLNPPKRSKSNKPPSKPGLLNAVEQPGGLKIVRGSSRDPSPNTSSQPSSSRTMLDTTKAQKNPRQNPSRSLPTIEEDVRAMEQETNILKQTPRAHNKSHSTSILQESTIAIPESETPQINRNKKMRDEAMSRYSQQSRTPTPTNGRRGSRGKRLSSSGSLTQPHKSVPDDHLYKHIDPDLPEPERFKTLVIWALARAMNEYEAASSKLSPAAMDLFKRTIERTRVALAENRVDLSFTPNPTSGSLKPNEQNENLRQFHLSETEEIRKLKAEVEGFDSAAHVYEDFLKRERAKLDKRRKALNAARQKLSAKARGKQKASMDSGEPLVLTDASPELQHYLTLTQEVLGSSSSSSQPYAERNAQLNKDVEGLRLNLDKLFDQINTAQVMTTTAERMLDHRFAILGASLKARSNPPAPVSYPPDSRSGSRVLSTYAPRLEPVVDDPRDLLRALALVDSERPPGQVSDSARTAAREVQRAEESGAAAIGQRRLTDVYGTPRKAPGTPRSRANTPGR